MAVICCAVPSGIVALSVVIAIAVSNAAETVSVRVPAIVPDLALIVAVPIFRPVASPEVLTFTTPSGELLHETELVKSRVLPSV